MSVSLVAERIGVQVGERRLLHDVSLQVTGGETVIIIGPNGAGKSTLLAALAGDLILASGRVLINDREIAQLKPKQLALLRAVLPQQSVIQFAFTCREIVEMGRGPQKNAGDGDLAIDRALELVDAVELGNRMFPTLSVGEQARVSLARVLAQETPVLLLDEPTAALDLRHQQLVMQVAKRLAARGAAIVAILHDLNLAAAYADRIVLLHRGEVVADGSPWETMTEPLLEMVFECPVVVTPHPQIGCPLVVPQCPVWPIARNTVEAAGVALRDETR